MARQVLEFCFQDFVRPHVLYPLVTRSTGLTEWVPLQQYFHFVFQTSTCHRLVVRQVKSVVPKVVVGRQKEEEKWCSFFETPSSHPVL